ncbi:unnamed protein product [Ectocarpus sp. 12 AP-2014]
MRVGYSFHRATTTACHTIPTRQTFAPKDGTAARGDKPATKLTSKTSNRAFTPQQCTANQIFWQLVLIKVVFQETVKTETTLLSTQGFLAPNDGGDGCPSLSSRALKKHTYTHNTSLSRFRGSKQHKSPAKYQLDTLATYIRSVARIIYPQTRQERQRRNMEW